MKSSHFGSFVAILSALGLVVSSVNPARAGKLERTLAIGAAIGAGVYIIGKALKKHNRKRRRGKYRKARRGGNGMSKSHIRAIQAALNARGFNAGRPDGIMGRGTRNAIRRFQKHIGHPVTGRLTRKEFSILTGMGGAAAVTSVTGSRAAGSASSAYVERPDYTPEILSTPLPLCLEHIDKARRKCGIVLNDRWILDPVYKDVEEFGKTSEGLAKVETQEGKFGYVDKTGKWVIPPSFQWIDGLKNGVACVTVSEGKSGCIDISGRWIIRPEYYKVSRLEEDLFSVVVSKGGLVGIVDIRGEWVVRPTFKRLYGPYRDGTAVAVAAGADMDGKYGLIDRKGRWVVKPEFEMIYFAEEGFIFAKKEKYKWGAIDRHGEWIIPPKFKHLGGFSEGLLLAQDSNGKYGYIDKSGKWVIPPRFRNLYVFSEGLILAQVSNKKYGYIDRSGKWVIPPSFKEAGNFQDGLASVSLDGVKYGYINKYGEWVIKPEFTIAFDFKYGLAVAGDYAMGIINKKGLFIVNPEYRFIDMKGKGIYQVQYGGYYKNREGVYRSILGNAYIDERRNIYPSFAKESFKRFRKRCRRLISRPWALENSVKNLRLIASCSGMIHEWAKQDDPDAIYALFIFGDSNKKEENRARIIKAAKLGHKYAMVELARAYDSGASVIGIEPDLKKAVYWYERAAAVGEASAQARLGEMYARGHGVPRDLRKALYWTEQSIINGRGDPDFTDMKTAKHNRRVLKRMLAVYKRYKRGTERNRRRDMTLLDAYRLFVEPYVPSSAEIAKQIAERKAKVACHKRKYRCLSFCKKIPPTKRVIVFGMSPIQRCVADCKKMCR